MGVGGRGVRLPASFRHPSTPSATPAPQRVCVLPNLLQEPGRAGARLDSRSPASARSPHLRTQQRVSCCAALPPPLPPPPPLRGARPSSSRETGRGPPCRAIPPLGPCLLAPGLAAYLSSSPRRAHGRPRPRGDIRSPGSDSGPHLQAPAAAGEAPRPATGGGSAERRRCSGGRPPLGSVRSPV